MLHIGLLGGGTIDDLVHGTQADYWGHCCCGAKWNWVTDCSLESMAEARGSASRLTGGSWQDKEFNVAGPGGVKPTASDPFDEMLQRVFPLNSCIHVGSAQ